MGLVGVIRKARFTNVRAPTGETGVQDRFSNTLRTPEGETIYDWPQIDEDMMSTFTPEQRKQIERWKRRKPIASSPVAGKQ